jgi:hypothetical protein
VIAIKFTGIYGAPVTRYVSFTAIEISEPFRATKVLRHTDSGSKGTPYRQWKQRYASALNSGERSHSRSCQFTPAIAPRYPLNRRLGGPQSRSGRFRKSIAPARIGIPDRPARSQFAIPTLDYKNVIGHTVFNAHPDDI